MQQENEQHSQNRVDPDLDRQAQNLGVAHPGGKIVGVDAAGLGVAAGEAHEQVHGSQGGDHFGDPGLGDNQTVNQAAGQAHQDRHSHAGAGAPGRCGAAAEDGAEDHHAADGKIHAAGDDNQGHGQGDHADFHDVAQHGVDDVVRLQEGGGHGGDGDENRGPDQKQNQIERELELFHDACTPAFPGMVRFRLMVRRAETSTEIRMMAPLMKSAQLVLMPR